MVVMMTVVMLMVIAVIFMTMCLWIIQYYIL